MVRITVIGGIFLLTASVTLFADEASDGSSLPLSGSTSLKYRLRWSGGDSDHDLFSTLGLNMWNEQKDKLSLSAAGRGSWDLDGDQDNRGYYAFDSISDTFDHRLNGRLSHAYANLRGYDMLQSLKVDRIRLGRQYTDEGDSLHFDGGRIDSLSFASLKDLQFSIYGGLPVHLYESSPEGDSLIGAGMQFEPIAKMTLRADWQRVKDDSRYSGEETSDLMTIGGAYPLGKNVRMDGRLTILEAEARDTLVRAVVTMPEQELTANLSVFNQYKILKDYAIDFDPFYAVLKEYYPYYQINAHVTKGCSTLWKPLSVGAGVLVREVIDGDDIGQFNQEFRRYYLKPTMSDWPVVGMEVGLTGELWDTTDDDIYTLGLDLAHQCTEKIRASTGTYYSRYKYDEYGDSERERVRTIYLKTEYAFAAKTVGYVEYENEKDDFDRYQTVEIGLKYRF